jgi:hypothetical protein
LANEKPAVAGFNVILEYYLDSLVIFFTNAAFRANECVWKFFPFTFGGFVMYMTAYYAYVFHYFAP